MQAEESMRGLRAGGREHARTYTVQTDRSSRIKESKLLELSDRAKLLELSSGAY